jgi:hypothetical protein
MRADLRSSPTPMPHPQKKIFGARRLTWRTRRLNVRNRIRAYSKRVPIQYIYFPRHHVAPSCYPFQRRLSCTASQHPAPLSPMQDGGYSTNSGTSSPTWSSFDSTAAALKDLDGFSEDGREQEDQEPETENETEEASAGIPASGFSFRAAQPASLQLF